MKLPQNKEEWQEKLQYLFCRNVDLTKHKRFFNVLKLIYDRFRAKLLLRKGGIKRAQKSYKNRKAESWVILQYERICRPEDTPIPIGSNSFVRPETFVKQCEALKKHASVIPLEILLGMIRSGQEVPAGTVVITIDGGFQDAFLHAFPALLQYDLAATVCVPTAYINTPALLLDDMVALSLKLFEHNKKKLDPFKSLSDKMNASFLSTTKNGIPKPESVITFLSLYFALSPEKRKPLLDELGERLKELSLGAPPWQDFMTWEEMKTLQQYTFSCISKFHSHPPIWNLGEEEIQQELVNANRELESNGWPKIDCVALPYGVYSERVLDSLHAHNISFALSTHLAPPITEQDHQTKVLRRLPISQGVGLTEELFLTRIWDLL